MTTGAPDPARCPLCGGPNGCGNAAGAATCWCSSTTIPAEVLERVPPAARDKICVCAKCAAGNERRSRPLRVVTEDGGERGEPKTAR